MKEMGNFYSFLWILLLINLTSSKDIQINLGLNKVKLSQSVDAFPQQANCTDLERPICVRNVTYRNLVAVCAPNIPMPGTPASCPVFTFTVTTPPIPIVQPDPIATCKSCSRYNVWDIEKYPECLILGKDTPTPHTSDIPTTHTSDIPTTHTSDVTRSSAGRKEQQENGLSGKNIAAIVTPGIALLLALVVLPVLYKFGCLTRLVRSRKTL
ncbi:uncharacterized protein LOC134276588 [Saccostrea cucullata]|uniref:uncharacterized protein LOC134276588 n=1 Tax=Saccostrea cuccullata TaxID=36930 RepID=UPI002ED25F81